MLIANGTVITADQDRHVYERGFVLVEGDHVAAVGEGEVSEEQRISVGKAIDAADKVVMPGLINAHAHLFQTLIRGLSDSRELVPWLQDVAFPVYEHMNSDDVYLATLIGAMENIRGGATAVIDNVTVRQDLEGYNSAFRAAERAGVRYKMARGYSDTAYPEALMESPDEIIESTRRLYETWHGEANGRLRIDFSPNVVWSTTESALLRVVESAREWGIGIHIHTAESRIEQEMSIRTNGMRQVEWLAEVGALGPNVLLAHAIWLNDSEIELVGESGASVSYNPVSNMFLASGVCPVSKLRASGVPVGIGTDGQAVNDGQEMLDVLKWAANLQKVDSLNATVLSPGDVIQMACNEGAVAFGQPELIGSLEPGKKADLILVDMGASRLTIPSLSLPSLLVNLARSGDVDTVIVGGEILMRDRQVLAVDEEALLAEFRHARRSLLQRAGIA